MTECIFRHNHETIANGLRKSAVVKQNVESADGTEFLLPSNSIPQIGRMDKPILHNSYYDVTSDNPLIITKRTQMLFRAS